MRGGQERALALDITGEYLVWMSNLGRHRMDLLMVCVPLYRLGG